jgi:hypothetical protein
MGWNTNAIGLVTKTAGWANPAFDFIVGYAGGDWTRKTDGTIVYEPNVNLKSIELQARAEKKPFLALWDFDVEYYSTAQYMPDDTHWPPLDNDYPYKALVAALANRDIDGLVIRIMNRSNLAGKPELMSYVAYAAKQFVTRVNKWLYTTKGLRQQTIVLTTDAFLRQDKNGAEENFYSWMKLDFPGIAVEQAAAGLVNSYPGDAEKPGAIGNTSWKFWYYLWSPKTEPKLASRGNGLMLYNGDAAALRGYLGLGAVTPPVPVDPPVEPPAPASVDLKPVIDILAGIAADIAAIRKDVHEVRLKFS